ncbi:MAG TPA: TonB-dependent receptor [Terracidiphilus sp.]|nr:TonB-dependent receptor [Terracidiphilus sp.]
MLALAVCAQFALPQTPSAQTAVALTVVDENGAAVAGAEGIVEQTGSAAVRVATDYNGHANFVLSRNEAYHLRVQKPGFYLDEMNESDTTARDVRVVLTHLQMVMQQVNVSASSPGIDPEQVPDKMTLALPEIINIPYPTSRDIRNLLPYFPGVIQDASGQVHVAGSETWATLDTLDNFDIRSPVSGILAMRFSADAVRSIDQETTRYPVQYGRSTGGVVAFYTGMGDNKFRFNATDFLPSFENINGIRFDKVVPRITFSGPIKRDRAWFFDGLEVEYDDIYIKELPESGNTNHLIRGSNLVRAQVNVTPRNIFSAGLLLNDYHSPYDGLSPLVPQESTTKRNTVAWLPYVRDQQSFHNGALLDVGLGLVHFRDGYEPYSGSPFELTPELSQGSYFESLTSRSQRVEGNALLYMPPWHGLGKHSFQAGIDLDHIGYDEAYERAPVNYLREDRTLLRQSTFPDLPPFKRHNVEVGAYVQDRWTPHDGFLIEPGLRFDWDEIVRRPLLAPRIAAVWSPPGSAGVTKISAGIGLYYEHTQLEYLTRALAGIRYDTMFGADGMTPLGPAAETNFTFNPGAPKEAYALNWSVGAEQKLPGAIYLKGNYMYKRVADEFVYANVTAPGALSGTYALTNAREDHDTMEEIEARHTFSGNYTLFGAYTHSSARTNAAIDYFPTITEFGAQQSGALPWDVPNRVLSWGWLPFLVPGFAKHWDFVYTADRRSGFPFTAISANHEVVGAANEQRFPHYIALSPGLEWKFHFHGMYLGLRGVLENATNSGNYTVVNNVVDSPQYGMFSGAVGRAVTARIRLIQSNR